MTIIPYYSQTEIKSVIKTLEETAIFYAGLMNQLKFKFQTVCSARFDEQNKEGQVDRIEIYIDFNNNHNFTQIDINDNIVRFQSEQQENKPKNERQWMEISKK